MLNLIHKVSPVPSDLGSHIMGMLCAAYSGDFQLLASGKEGVYVFLAIEHAPIAGQDCMSGIYVGQCEKKDRGRAVAFKVQSEHDAPFNAACCPARVLKAATALRGNQLFRDTSALFQKSKKAMSTLKIGDIVFFRRGAEMNSPGQQMIVARYANQNLWERHLESGPNGTLTADPHTLYRFAPEIVYPELLDPIRHDEGLDLVSGFYFKYSGGEYTVLGRPYSEFELAKIRRDNISKAQESIAARQANRRRAAFV